MIQHERAVNFDFHTGALGSKRMLARVEVDENETLAGDEAVAKYRSSPVWKSTSVSGAPRWLRRGGTGIATPSSRRRIDGVEDDAMIQHERVVKF